MHSTPHAPTHSKPGDTQLGHIHTSPHLCNPITYKLSFPVTHIYMINKHTPMFTHKKSYVHRTESTYICSQLLHTCKSISMNSPAHGPVDMVDIHAHISPSGMQIPGNTPILAKCGIAPWASRHTGPDVSTSQTEGQFLNQGHENVHGPLDRHPKY